MIWMLFRSSNSEEEEKYKEESMEMLRVIEEEALKDDKKFFGGDDINLVDLAFGAYIHWLGVIEEVVGVKVFEPQRFPRLHAWIHSFIQLQVISENLPDRDEMLSVYKRFREYLLASST